MPSKAHYLSINSNISMLLLQSSSWYLLIWTKYYRKWRNWLGGNHLLNFFSSSEVETFLSSRPPVLESEENDFMLTKELRELQEKMQKLFLKQVFYLSLILIKALSGCPFPKCSDTWRSWLTGVEGSVTDHPKNWFKNLPLFSRKHSICSPNNLSLPRWPIRAFITC